MRIHLTIPGDPIPWARPAGKYHRYDSQASEKELVRLQMRSELSRLPADRVHLPYNAALALRVTFYVKIDPRDSDGLKNAKLWGFEPMHQKPDLDNLAKFYLDCGNGLLWVDDKRIQIMRLEKQYSEKCRTEIEIMTINNLKVPESVEGVMRIFGPDKLREFSKNVKSLEYINEDNIETSMGEFESHLSEQWLSWTALQLVRFAQAHAEDLKKILKYSTIENDCNQLNIGKL
jgi:Holliday junction resolvase RusA-like endonuclease